MLKRLLKKESREPENQRLISGCPRCMNIICESEFHIVDKSIQCDRRNQNLDICDCGVPYITLAMSVDEYDDRYRIALYNVSDFISISPEKYRIFIQDCALFPLQKYMYDNFFDHSLLDHTCWRVIRFFAFMGHNTKEGNQYFIDKYGETYESLYEKTHNEKMRKEKALKDIQQLENDHKYHGIRQEALHPTPKCPICGSTNLSKISALKKAAKIYTFGIFGAGDVGKTYKCENCGAKF